MIDVYVLPPLLQYSGSYRWMDEWGKVRVTGCIFSALTIAFVGHRSIWMCDQMIAHLLSFSVWGTKQGSGYCAKRFGWIMMETSTKNSDAVTRNLGKYSVLESRRFFCGICQSAFFENVNAGESVSKQRTVDKTHKKCRNHRESRRSIDTFFLNPKGLPDR